MTAHATTNPTNAATTGTPRTQRGFDGMLQILRFNWLQYTAGVLTVGATVLAMATLSWPPTLNVLLGVGVVTASFWLVASLVVSHWVYDRSGVFDLSWVRDVVDRPVQRYVNIHFGFDTGSAPAREAFPHAQATTWDTFDRAVTRERSLLRARATTKIVPGDACDFRNLPDVGDMDAVFLVLTAHELRDRGLRERFFAELFRVTASGGSVVILEHARDLANFAAFGFGFVHFLPASEWRRLADVAGFTAVHEHRATPFVRAIVLRK